MMKKKLFSIAMAALVVCGMAVLTGCGHDDEPTIPDSKGESGQTTTPTQKKSFSAVYTVKLADAFFKVAASKVVITYYNGNNQIVADTITSGTTWSKSITPTQFPAKLGITLAATRRPASEIADGVYDLESTYGIRTIITKDGFTKESEYKNNWFVGYDNDPSSEVEKGTYTKEQLVALPDSMWVTSGMLMIFDSSYTETSSTVFK